jgi:WD40 repeat protein
VRLWRADLGAEVGGCAGHTKAVRTVVFDHTGALLATASLDGTARLWDATTGRELRRLTHRGEVHAVAFSPDAGRLATGSRDGSVRIWDIPGGDELAVLQRHKNAVVGLAFDAAGTVLASAAWDNTARLWCGKRRILPSAATR